MQNSTPGPDGRAKAGNFLVSAARRLRRTAAAAGPRVLICEDDAVLALELEALVAESGATSCGIASSREEALELARLAQPDLVLLDLHLDDGRSGPALAEDFAGRGIRIVVVSGDTAIDRKLARIDHVFLPKPVQAAVLRDILTSFAAPSVPAAAAGQMPAAAAPETVGRRARHRNDGHPLRVLGR